MGRFDALTQLDTKPEKVPATREKPASPQTVLPVNLQTREPASPQDGKPANPLAGKTVHLQTRKPFDEVVEKYTTRLKPSLIKQIKQYALEYDIKDYEVVQQEVKEFL